MTLFNPEMRSSQSTDTEPRSIPISLNFKQGKKKSNKASSIDKAEVQYLMTSAVTVFVHFMFGALFEASITKCLFFCPLHFALSCLPTEIPLTYCLTFFSEACSGV